MLTTMLKSILVGGLTMIALPLQASILTWNINGTGLTEGTVKGSFQYNTETTALFDVALISSGFGSAYDISVSNVNPSFESLNTGGINIFMVNIPGEVVGGGGHVPNAQTFSFWFQGDLSSPGPIPLFKFNSTIFAFPAGGSSVPFTGTLTQGSPLVTPIPSALIMFISGIFAFCRNWRFKFYGRKADRRLA
ncbi:hypothetical protein [Methylomonas koyamae]|uniref:hypothetical protein n=1 Tax=Methylomonas koyamae TaxID=702114 RepID=UPI0016427E88|nr:hypothetical protein [Methylomonas koyamae]